MAIVLCTFDRLGRLSKLGRLGRLGKLNAYYLITVILNSNNDLTHVALLIKCNYTACGMDATSIIINRLILHITCNDVFLFIPHCFPCIYCA